MKMTAALFVVAVACVIAASAPAVAHVGEAAVEKIQIEQHSFGGLLWLMGWLFTIGLLNLTFWKGLLALLLWPYYIGVLAATLRH